MTNEFIPPNIWTMEDENGGKWGSINRPDSGARFQRELPVGKQPLQLHSLATPNGQKVTIMLEELLALGVKEAEYDAYMIKIGDSDQFSSGFVEINPNSKIPALYDTDAQVNVFESGSILLHLAEKFGHFLPATGAKRTQVMNWLFWLQGSAPYLGGGFGHFYAYAPEKFQYPINRFSMEAKRQLDVLDKQLANNTYLAGDEYSIADMATWPWYGNLVLGNLYDAATFLDVNSYQHVVRWAKLIEQRQAVKRGIVVNRAWGEKWEQVPERHCAADIDKVLSLKP
ncbi:glutathione-dependent disulfide-bond oxidoreductase [Shewanella intestini]|uniref:Glutathione-dependent disulfide-bond oxidoreductase n=1 Tax=Shewanella intestini TaxID=2017544 RepID=A0ABS5I1R9_9GAMM|nr:MULTISPECIES: glutathione-dependent disulfide-bond oxidoreductase [Shewanella]MBR9727360.1 glutathione-dependent disulfide-bond oxidoreductase [Shewanella intestini]MRG35590.1 glutathione-dependent disulfide-bond oxidoreductase [Shewanella sp. XMDDZSB0408]